MKAIIPENQQIVSFEKEAAFSIHILDKRINNHLQKQKTEAESESKSVSRNLSLDYSKKAQIIHHRTRNSCSF